MLIRYLIVQKITAVLAENLLLVTVVLLDPIRSGIEDGGGFAVALYVARALFLVTTFQVFLHLMDVYDFRVNASRWDFTKHLGKGILLGGIFVAAVHFAVPALTTGFGRTTILVFRMSAVVVVWHGLVRIYFNRYVARARVLIVGTGHLARALAVEILRRPELGLSVVGFVDDKEELLGVSIVNPKVIGLTNDLAQVVSDSLVSSIVVELQDRRGRLPTNDLLALKTRGIKIEEATSLYERLAGKIALESLKPSWMIFNEGFDVSRNALLKQEILSLVLSVFLSILLLPLVPFIALLIKIDSRGPVFYKQERVGQDGKIFTIFKFRSMRMNAEKETGPVWAAADGDNRVTRVGKYLRRTRLDEIPQLYNVLMGDMNIVGPRPERPTFVRQLSDIIPFYQLRHSVRPGLTGWAQINYRYGSSVEDAVEKLQYDLFYIKNMSLLLDCIVIFDTIKTVVVCKGS
jgi:sugar transferase (PEP-CTERM system associated)